MEDKFNCCVCIYNREKAEKSGDYCWMLCKKHQKEYDEVMRGNYNIK